MTYLKSGKIIDNNDSFLPDQSSMHICPQSAKSLLMYTHHSPMDLLQSAQTRFSIYLMWLTVRVARIWRRFSKTWPVSTWCKLIIKKEVDNSNQTFKVQPSKTLKRDLMVSGELSQLHPTREIMNFHRWYNHPNSNIILMSCRRKILQPTQIQLSSKACQALPIVDPNPMPISKKRKNFHPISIKEKDQCLSTPIQMLLV